MFVVANRVPVAAGYEEMFEERFRRRAGQVERNPGFVRMDVMKPLTPDTPFVVNTVWENREAFDAWVDSEDFKLAHSHPMPREAFSGQGKMEQYEIVISSEKSP